jgi:dihydrofolate synthase/folylpolyglutamate synthase
VNIALNAAIKNANQQDLILVIGSVFLVAEVDRTNFS